MEKKNQNYDTGIAMMFILAMSGCGVNHKNTRGGSGISDKKEYTDGSEKKGEGLLCSEGRYQRTPSE